MFKNCISVFGINMILLINLLSYVYAEDMEVIMSSVPSNFTIKDNTQTELFRVQNNGNVGIATSSPSERLEVEGTIKATRFKGDGSGLVNLPGITAPIVGHSLAAVDGDPIDALFVDSSGFIGVGTVLPNLGNNPTTRAVMSIVGPGDGGVLELGSEIVKNGIAVGSLNFFNAESFVSSIQAISRFGTATASELLFFTSDGLQIRERVRITNNGDVGIGTIIPAGKLDVNGSIVQRGEELHADYVFEPSYDLESIADHSEFMWKNKHLMAIPKATKDNFGNDIVEVGVHRKGIVEELEKAHIYIDQLNNRLKIQEKDHKQQLTALREEFNKKYDELITILEQK